MEEKQLSNKERLEQKIAQIKAQLRKTEAKFTQSQRKERNGHLIAFGVLVEEIFKAGDEKGQQKLIEAANRHLKDRTLAKALDGFKRLAAAPKVTPKGEISPGAAGAVPAAAKGEISPGESGPSSPPKDATAKRVKSVT